MKSNQIQSNQNQNQIIMEWPKANVPDDLFAENEYWNDPHTDYELLVSTITSTLITKEIYARAAMACVSDITLDHDSNGLRSTVNDFLNTLRRSSTAADDDTDDQTAWIASEYRTISRDFVELMSLASSISYERIYDICQGGLDAVHDLFKYRLPSTETGSWNDNCDSSSSSSSVLSAKDAYVLCQSLSPKLTTERVSGTRAPDMDYKFGLVQEHTRIVNKSVGSNDANSLYGIDACRYVTQLRNDGYMETSACSLAKYTFTATAGLQSQTLTHTTFIVLGCDHPLAPTKSLLRIPGVTVLGVPTSWKGLDDILDYVRYNSPDDTTFVYPTGGCCVGGGATNTTKNDGRRRRFFDGNYIVSHGPHIAQWILDNTISTQTDTDTSTSTTGTGGGDRQREQQHEHELVLVPMAGPTSSSRNECAVRYAAASDLIVQRVLRARHNNNSDTNKLSLWMYQSSTTCMVVPPASTTKSNELLQQRPMHEPWIRALSGNTVLTPTVDEDTTNHGAVVVDATTTTDASSKKKKEHYYSNTTTTNNHKTKNNNNHEYAVVNGIIAAPGGAHDVLAETIRLWRCLVTNLAPYLQHRGDTQYDSDDEYDDYEEDDDGTTHRATTTTTSNTTTTTTTSSRNEIHVFAPYVPLWKKNDDDDDTTVGGGLVAATTEPNELVTESNVKVFDIGTASSLMTAIGLAGLLNPIVNRPLPILLDDDVGAAAGATTTPFSLFWNGSVHGGIWNCPYTLNSVSGVTGYVLGKLYNYYDTYAAPYMVAVTATAASSSSNDETNTEPTNNTTGSTNDPSSSPSGIQTVPSTFGEPMPDIVRERLEVLA